LFVGLESHTFAGYDLELSCNQPKTQLIAILEKVVPPVEVVKTATDALQLDQSISTLKGLAEVKDTRDL